MSLTATDGVSLAALESAALAELERVRQEGITPHELQKAKSQLRARMVFEGDSITNIAHQLGFFATIDSWSFYAGVGPRIEAVTLEQVAAVAQSRLKASNRTIGWFEPQA